MLNHKLAFMLHKTGVYKLLDSGRDFVQLLRAGRRTSFSQYGEDMFLSEYFGGRKGAYIEIGGNHPFRLSNTYLLYRMGWSGVVVEPIRNLYNKHKRFRPRDIQVNAAAGDSTGNLTFYEMVPSILSTCNPDEAKTMLATGSVSLLRKYTVPVVTINDLYRKHLASYPVLLLSIDTEGYDLPVLRGIDWKVMHPELVICEANDATAETAITQFLAEQGYECLKVLGCNRIFAPR